MPQSANKTARLNFQRASEITKTHSRTQTQHFDFLICFATCNNTQTNRNMKPETTEHTTSKYNTRGVLGPTLGTIGWRLGTPSCTPHRIIKRSLSSATPRRDRGPHKKCKRRGNGASDHTPPPRSCQAAKTYVLPIFWLWAGPKASTLLLQKMSPLRV